MHKLCRVDWRKKFGKEKEEALTCSISPEIQIIFCVGSYVRTYVGICTCVSRPNYCGLDLWVNKQSWMMSMR